MYRNRWLIIGCKDTAFFGDIFMDWAYIEKKIVFVRVNAREGKMIVLNEQR